MKPVNVGLLGTGFMGRTHTYAYKSIPFYIQSPDALARMVAVYSRTPEKAVRFKEVHGFSKVYLNDWRKLIDDKEVEVVDNTLPNFLHYEPCLYALESGKNVICEKPLTVKLEEARKLYEKSIKTGVKTMSIFNYRFLPAVKFMKNFISSGQIGKLFHFRCVFAHSGHVDVNRPWSWKENFETSGGGASADLGIHAIDLARYLVGEISKVMARERIFIPERKDPTGETKKVTADDAFMSLLEFENGALGILEATRVGTGYKNYLRVEIHGSEGGLVWNLEDLNYVKVFKTEGPRREQGWKVILVDLPWWPPRGHIGGWQTGHVFALYNFLEAIVKDEKELAPTFYDGYQAQRVLEAIHRSNKENRWIDLEMVR